MTTSVKSPIAPPLKALLDGFRRDLLKNTHCVKPAEIVSYNASEGTAEVQILLQQQLDTGAFMNYPLLLDVPVVTIYGGGVTLGAPIMAGDQGLVLFADRNIDGWFASGSAQPPFSARLHDISDGFMIVGVRPKNLPLVSALQVGEGGVAGATAKVAVDSSTEKVTIQNSSANLAVQLENLVTAVQALVTALGAMTTTSVGNGTTAAACAAQAAPLTAVLTALEALLY